MSRPVYAFTITEEHIGHLRVTVNGRPYHMGFMGRILPGDVGKRVYQVGDILQVENDQQRDERVAKGC